MTRLERSLKRSARSAMDWAMDWISESRWSRAEAEREEEGENSCCWAREGVVGERTERDCEEESESAGASVEVSGSS
jgi:hypothetical protein